VSTNLAARFQQTDVGAFDARRRSHLAWFALVIYSALFLLAVAVAVLVVRRRRRRSPTV
jgi:hypothetical protein